MAPNLDVKSESWLDLSMSANYNSYYRKELSKGKKFKNNQPRPININYSNDSQSDTYRHRHSISNFYVPSPDSKNSTNQRTPANSNNIKSQQQQQHLLIRLRQQSYLNRSSNSLSSNLSNSIDLNPSLVAQSETNCDYYCSSRRRFADELIREEEDHQQQQHHSNRPPLLLKRESQKLTALRNKLQQKGRPICQHQTLSSSSSLSKNINNNKQSTTTSEEGGQPAPSPLLRSITSFSQRISGKFNHFRHSWKHFLYNYNQNNYHSSLNLSLHKSHQEDYHADQDESDRDFYNHHRYYYKAGEGFANNADQAEQEVNKRKLTDEWITRHQHLIEAGSQLELSSLDAVNPGQRNLHLHSRERPRSLQIDSHSTRYKSNQQQHSLLIGEHYAGRSDIIINTPNYSLSKPARPLSQQCTNDHKNRKPTSTTTTLHPLLNNSSGGNKVPIFIGNQNSINNQTRVSSPNSSTTLVSSQATTNIINTSNSCNNNNNTKQSYHSRASRLIERNLDSRSSFDSSSSGLNTPSPSPPLSNIDPQEETKDLLDKSKESENMRKRSNESPPVRRSKERHLLELQQQQQFFLQNQHLHKQQQQQQQQLQSQQPVATSDYWSTVNSNELALNSQQPILLGAKQSLTAPDHQYYLDVAANSHQQQLLNQRTFEQIILNQLPSLSLEDQNNNSNSNLAARQAAPSNLANLTHTNIVISPSTEHQPPITMSSHQTQPLANLMNYQQQQQQQLHQEQLMAGDEDYDDYAVPADESCRLDRSQVELVQMIGEGQKGFVFLGKLQSKDGQTIMDVAIKTLKYETSQLIDKLMREASMMRQLEHPHIIKFIGVCPETPALIAMELAEFGEIKQYFKLNKHLILTSQLILFTFQISTALSYLESKQYVHRDVAARNILVCSHNCVKLADFGLSRNLQPAPNSNNNNSNNSNLSQQQQQQLGIIDNNDNNNNYVAANSKGKLPVRWLSPESLTFKIFTSASDVWMFAVCTWELFQFCQVRPWQQIRNNQVLLAIESGQRLERPQNCPLRLYQLMMQCWSYAPVQRPKFRDLKQSLWSIYLNERAKEHLEIEQQQQQQQRILNAVTSRQQQQHDRLLLLMNNNNNLSSANSGCNSSPSPSPTNLLPNTNQFANGAASSKLKQQPNVVGAPASRFINNSAGNSGYSSGGATATTIGEHSNNSSRSSSMGSLARQQAKLWQQQQQQRARVVVSPNQVSNNHFNGLRQQLPLDEDMDMNIQRGNKFEKQQADINISGSSGGSSSSNIKQTARSRAALVESNMKRFQRMPGQVLQKQRSQGSIVVNSSNNFLDQQQPITRAQLVSPTNGPRNKPEMRNSFQRQQQQYGYDDNELLERQQRTRRLQQSTMVNYCFEEDDDDDDDYDSSTSEGADLNTTTTLLEPAHVRLQNSNNKLWLIPPPLATRQLKEPTYEGLQAAESEEIAMIKGTSPPIVLQKDKQRVSAGQQFRQQPIKPTSRPSSMQVQEEDRRNMNNNQMITSSSGAGRTGAKKQSTPVLEQLTSEQSKEEKLADVIKSLKSCPLKAKLTYNNANSSSSSNNNNNKSKSPIIQQTSTSASCNEASKLEKDRQEELRQLALHQRLLGNIRPQSAGSSKRRSAQLVPENSSSPISNAHQHHHHHHQQSACSAETSVDQSLQILESLIDEDSRAAAAKVSSASSASSSSMSLAANKTTNTTNNANQQQQQHHHRFYRGMSLFGQSPR